MPAAAKVSTQTPFKARSCWTKVDLVCSMGLASDMLCILVKARKLKSMDWGVHSTVAELILPCSRPILQARLGLEVVGFYKRPKQCRFKLLANGHFPLSVQDAI